MASAPPARMGGDAKRNIEKRQQSRASPEFIFIGVDDDDDKIDEVSYSHVDHPSVKEKACPKIPATTREYTEQVPKDIQDRNHGSKATSGASRHAKSNAGTVTSILTNNHQESTQSYPTVVPLRIRSKRKRREYRKHAQYFHARLESLRACRHSPKPPPPTKHSKDDSPTATFESPAAPRKSSLGTNVNACIFCDEPCRLGDVFCEGHHQQRQQYENCNNFLRDADSCQSAVSSSAGDSDQVTLKVVKASKIEVTLTVGSHSESTSYKYKGGIFAQPLKNAYRKTKDTHCQVAQKAKEAHGNKNSAVEQTSKRNVSHRETDKEAESIRNDNGDCRRHSQFPHAGKTVSVGRRKVIVNQSATTGDGSSSSVNHIGTSLVP